MASPALEDLLPQSGFSVYRLVRMAANRAMELAEGKPRLIEKPSSDKETTTALEEISKGRIIFKELADPNRPVFEEKEAPPESAEKSESEQDQETEKIEL